MMIVMDADSQGRAAAARIAEDLVGHAEAEIVDLDHGRDDGYDLTDWLAEHPEPVDIAEFRGRTPPAQRRRQ